MLSFREKYEMKKASRTKLVEAITIAADIAELDPTRVKTRISMARSSKWGEVTELIFILGSIYKFPLNKEDKEFEKISSRQEEIASSIELAELDLLLDLLAMRGNFSFLDQNTNEIIEGVEPDPDLGEAVALFCEINSLLNDFKMTPESWEKIEAIAREKAEAERKAAEEAIKLAKEMMG